MPLSRPTLATRSTSASWRAREDRVPMFWFRSMEVQLPWFNSILLPLAATVLAGLSALRRRRQCR